MAEMVLGVGTGVFIVALVWIVTLALSIILSRATGPTKLGIVPIFLLALTITLVLVFFPRATEVPSTEREFEQTSANTTAFSQCLLLPITAAELPSHPLVCTNKSQNIYLLVFSSRKDRRSKHSLCC
ncbi:transmembrane protein 218 isoform X2 [Triplophysa dalaica]|uniref:transmembrane protein 218 isoform X2 n=1 Tax=Triplophysa dalaica TaxID=1582913 RepID=UPI0024E0125C|nr:transmembrane protein 218 isoform X2 [Triplophysa dalaica]